MGYKKALEILELGETPSDKEPATKPGKQSVEVEIGQENHARIADVETETTESATDNVTPGSVLLPGRNAADQLEPEKANLAAATVLPLSLLGSKKVWEWIIVIGCIVIAGYLLYKWYKEKRKSISPPKQETQSVEEFINERYRNISKPS